jgi:hypothetical protein
MNWNKLKKQHNLILGLIFDLLGYVSFIFPPFDFVWAPLSGYLMTKLYEGKKGKIAGILVFIEEALPFLDIVPTFTIMWMYTYWNQSSKNSLK